MTLVLTIFLILIFLILIDLYRRNIRIRQKKVIDDIQKKESEKLLNQVIDVTDLSNVDNCQHEYPILREGFLLFYFETKKTISVKDLSRFLKLYGARYTDERVFQKFNNRDVIFSILPDSDAKIFNKHDEGRVKGIIAVMNYKKLSYMNYDIKNCYEMMMDILEDMSNNFGGTLMNEHKIRLTNKDKKKYLEAII